MQSHTVLKTIVHRYKGQHVLVLGGIGDDVRLTAERSAYIPNLMFPLIMYSYGFENVHTPLDIHAWNPR